MEAESETGFVLCKVLESRVRIMRGDGGLRRSRQADSG